MRRLLVVLLSVFMLAALVPAAALARPSYTINSLTVRGAGPYGTTDNCSVYVSVDWTAAKQIKAVRLIQDSGSGTSSSLTSVIRGANSYGQYFNDVDLDGFQFKWGAQLIGGGGKVLTTVWTGYENWNDLGCPASTQWLTWYPTT